MALNDLKNQNIQDTYQKVVQTDGTNLADGTGSLLPISFDGNNVTISGSLTANEYIVSSSVTNITVATLSGSTNFGDSQDDTHRFTGSLYLANDLKANAGFQIGPPGESLASTTANLSINGNIFTKTHITASGNISASGNIYADNFVVADGGFIRPATAGQSITVSPYSHGSAELLIMNEDTFDVKMNNSDVLNIDPTQFIVNGGHNAVDFKVDYEDASTAIVTDANNNRIKLRGHTSITVSGSATSPHAHDSVFGVKTALLISGSQANVGDLSIDGHITASGNISASGALIANTLTGTINGGSF
jgi:cytoskeletal protein CcmA (bactofilin family)